ncbi:MAG: cation:proton antiporter [Nitrososphaerales archaeon]
MGLAGIFILCGYASEYIFKRFGFPDIIILLAIGILIGPATGLVKRADIIDFAPILAALVITIILFNGGLNMNYQRMMSGGRRAAILAGATFVLAVIATTLITQPMLGWDPVTGMLLGAILGGISAAVVVPLVQKVTSSQRISTLLTLESSYTDVIVIMVSIAIVQFIVLQASPETLGSATSNLLTGIPIGAAIGVGGALAWVRTMTAMKTKAYEDILTLAIAFGLYGVAEYLGGSGPVAALAFGIMFGVASRLFQKTRHELPLISDSDIEVSARKFQSQIAFMVRAILFIFLGAILTVSGPGIVIAGIVIALILFFPRIAAAWIGTHRDEELRGNVWLISFMLPRGLAVGAAALLPLLYGIENSAIFMDLAFVVIVTTIAITTIGIHSMRLRAVGMPAAAATRTIQRGLGGSSDAVQKLMIFVAVGFAVAVGGAFAYDTSTNGQVFGSYAPIFEKNATSDIAVKPVGESRTYFFDSSETEKNAAGAYGSSKVISYTWDFGDGATSREPQAVHQYKEAGMHVVKLTLVREDGVVHTESMVLAVSD